MRDQPLHTLLRLRRLAQDEARLMLAGCLERESSAASRVRSIEQAIHAETDRATNLEGSDTTVETFALWLRHAREALAAANAALHEAEAGTHETRSVLSAARHAVEAVEAELGRREDVQRLASDRREQMVLDEIGGRAP